MIGIATAGMAIGGCEVSTGGSIMCFALPSSFACVLASNKKKKHLNIRILL